MKRRPRRSRARAAVLLAALLLLAPLGARAAEEVPDDATLEEIRAALGQDTRRIETTPNPEPPVSRPTGSGLGTSPELNPAFSIIGDFALAWFSEKEHAQRGGHDPTETGFNLQQLELSFQAAVDPYFKFYGNIVFSLFGVEVEEAYGQSLALPWNLQVRAGQFLSRFGRLNNSHPHSWDFVDQTMVHGRFFGSEGQRGLGLELSALLPLPWYVELVTTALGPDGGATMRSFHGNEKLGIDNVDDFVYVLALKQFFALSRDWSLAWGLSGAFGPNATGRDNRTEIYATDLYLKWRPISYGSYAVVSLQTEWMLRRRQVPGGVLQDFGGYAQLYWRFARRWAVAARYEFLSGVREDYLDPEEDDHEHRVSANVSFWPTEFSRLRLQYGLDVPTWRRDTELVHAVFLTLELVAGAHGAHTF